MKASAGLRGMRVVPLTMTAICVTAALALSGCASLSSAQSSAPGTATATAPASATASASATAACTADYCTPASWDTARAATPLTEIAPFSEPLNVVISARSTVSLTAIQQAMTKWETVSTTTTVRVTGIHIKCISSESADVTGNGYVSQQVAWRLGGCVDGNALSISGDEDHARIWHQSVPGSKNGAWFVAASYETMCVVHDGKLETAKSHLAYTVLHSSSAYHCVDGGPGSIDTAHPDGYTDGAQTFAAAVTAAARARGWQVTERTITVSRGASAGEGGVPFNGTVDVLTVTA
jgi:uncharacterized protein YceK